MEVVSVVLANGKCASRQNTKYARMVIHMHDEIGIVGLMMMILHYEYSTFGFLKDTSRLGDIVV